MSEASEQPVPYQKHSRTSKAAAASAKPVAKSLREQVLAYLIAQGDWGATDDEIQSALKMNPSTQRPRRVELVRLGLVEDSGSARETRAGRYAVVWRSIADQPQKG